jgi:heme/copper-type cytochrome/quinol oxidase subunit 3
MRLNRYKLAMVLFILSEGSFFALLVLAYVYFRTVTGSEPFAARVLDPLRTGIFSVCLFASSGTMELAGRSLRRKNLAGLRVWLFATIVLGAAFLVGQGSEYLHLYRDHVTISRNIFGTAFFTLTGFHGLHVFLGLVILSILFGLALNKDFLASHPVAVETASYYWHFVDAVWVVIFTVVYLWVFL